MQQTVLVTGGAGYIGSHVVLALAEASVGAVVTQRLIEACLSSGVGRFVFSSSAAVYGAPAVVPIPEDAACAPINPYGASKLASEFMLRHTAAASGLRCAILRYFNVAGADPAGRSGESTKGSTHLVKLACEVAVGTRACLEVLGDDYDTADGTCLRDYIHVSDLADLHLAALRQLDRVDGSLVLNCGYGRGFSVREIVAAVERVTGRPLPTLRGPRRPGDPPALVADVARLRAALDWTPRHADLDAILRSALAWERRLSSSAAARREVQV